jgi:hypothetical protein
MPCASCSGFSTTWGRPCGRRRDRAADDSRPRRNQARRARPGIADAYGIARRNYYYASPTAARRPASTRGGGTAARAAGSPGPRSSSHPRYHLTEAEHRARVAAWADRGAAHVLFGGDFRATIEGDRRGLPRERRGAGGARRAPCRGGAAPVRAEFALQRTGLFDRVIDGLNRVPRPALALGTLGLFVAAMVDPIWFAADAGHRAGARAALVADGGDRARSISARGIRRRGRISSARSRAITAIVPFMIVELGHFALVLAFVVAMRADGGAACRRAKGWRGWMAVGNLPPRRSSC